MVLLTLSLVFSLLAISGILISHRLFKDANKLIILGSGLALGPLGLLLVTSIVSYLFKGFAAQTLIFFIFTGATFYINRGVLKLGIMTSNFRKVLSKTNITLMLIVFIYLYLFFLIASGFDLGGDVDVYFSIATSFARGNYPSYLPWQPNFLTGYHMGAFMFEGVIYALTKISIYSIHCFFSAYIVTSLFLLLTGIGRIWIKSSLAVIPAVLTVILFGSPIILITGWSEFIHTILQLIKSPGLAQLRVLGGYPQFVDFKGSLGGGTGDFFGMFYRNFYPFSLVTYILSVYSLTTFDWKGRLKKKYLLAVILLVLTACIDESFFLLELVAVILCFLKDFHRKINLNTFRLMLLLSLAFVGLMVIVQNPIRDAILDPAKEGARFKILISSNSAVKSKNPAKFTLIPGDQEFMQYFNALDDAGTGKSVFGIVPIKFLWKNFNLFSGVIKAIAGTKWFLPNLLILASTALILSLALRNLLAVTFSLSALIVSSLGVFVVYTFFPPTSVRFVNQSAQLITLAYSLIIINIWRLLKRNQKVILGSLLLVLFAPQLLTAHSRALSYIVKPYRANFSDDSSLGYSKTLSNLQTILPYNAKLLFLDGYPFEVQASGITAEAITRAGFFVPIGPPDFKSVNSDASSEWVDAVLSLNPPSLKTLGVEYLFVRDQAVSRLQSFGVDINDTKYFQRVFQDELGTLYSVSVTYKNLPNQPTSIANLINQLPDNKIVYLDKFDLNELRRGLVLRLAKKDRLLGPGLSAGGDYFMYIETFLPFTYICEAPDLPACGPEITKTYQPIDYLITTPSKDISTITSEQYQEYFITPLVKIWKKR